MVGHIFRTFIAISFIALITSCSPSNMASTSGPSRSRALPMGQPDHSEPGAKAEENVPVPVQDPHSQETKSVDLPSDPPQDTKDSTKPSDDEKEFAQLVEGLKKAVEQGDQETLQKLSIKLRDLSRKLAPGIVMEQTIALSRGLENPDLRDFSKFVNWNLARQEIEFTTQFSALSPNEALSIMNGLQIHLKIARYQKQLAQAQNEPQKLFLRSQISMTQGNLPAARLQLHEFLLNPSSSNEKEFSDLAKEQLRTLSKNSLGEIIKMNQQSLLFADQTASVWSRPTLAKGNQLLWTLNKYFETQQALNIEDAIAQLENEYQQAKSKLENLVTVPAGNRYFLADRLIKTTTESFNESRQTIARFDSDSQNAEALSAWLDPRQDARLFPGRHIRLEGGTLSGEVLDQGIIRVVIGTQGGQIHVVNGYCYTFAPSNSEKVVIIRSGELQRLDRFTMDPQQIQIDPPGSCDRVERVVEEKTLQPAIYGIYQHWKLLERRDPALFNLIKSLETEKGLAQMVNSNDRRKHLLRLASELRNQSLQGDSSPVYNLIKSILSNLDSDAYHRSLVQITDDQIKPFKDQVEAQRAEIEQQVRLSFEDLKSKDPNSYQNLAPKLEENIQFTIEASLQDMLDSHLMVYAWRQGLIDEDIAAQAIELYNDIYDPNSEYLNMADESQRWFKELVIRETITSLMLAPLTSGVGTIVETIGSGIRLIKRLEDFGRYGSTAKKALLFLSSSAAQQITAQAALNIALGRPMDSQLAALGVIKGSILALAPKLLSGRLGMLLNAGNAGIARALRLGNSPVLALEFMEKTLAEGVLTTTMLCAHSVINQKVDPQNFFNTFGQNSLLVLISKFGSAGLSTDTRVWLVRTMQVSSMR